MKRNRPRQHKRKLKSGKTVVVNRGIKKRSMNKDDFLKMWQESEDKAREKRKQEEEENTAKMIAEIRNVGTGKRNERKELARESVSLQAKGVNEPLTQDEQDRLVRITSDIKNLGKRFSPEEIATAYKQERVSNVFQTIEPSISVVIDRIEENREHEKFLRDNNLTQEEYDEAVARLKKQGDLQ